MKADLITNQYQTPPEWIDDFRRILGGQIGLDPCYSNHVGCRFEPFSAEIWGIDDDALGKSVDQWQSHSSIYMNPPYSDPGPWAEILSQCACPWIALVNTQSSARWWHKLASRADFIAFPRRRIAFIDPITGKPAKGNRYDQTIFLHRVEVYVMINRLNERCTITRVKK